MPALYPLLTKPSLHAKVWGGRKLESVLHKNLPSADPYGEAWELHDSAIVTNGPLAQRSLGDLLAEYGADFIGPDYDPAEGLPLLAKFLDASDWLSVQNHPNDEQAHQLEGQPRGKTEAWYVLAAEADSQLVIGVKPGTTPESMSAAIENNALEDMLVYATVQPGDVLFIQAGTIHALGPGLLIYEIQQSSDTTYRLYDWGRMGLDGQPRELHIEKGVQVAALDSIPEIKQTAGQPGPAVDVVQSEYFTTRLYRPQLAESEQITLNTEGRYFHSLSCIQGQAVIRYHEADFVLKAGESAFIPAALGEYALSGDAQVLCSSPG
jgi:mannose-6-phosphate isomerase